MQSERELLRRDRELTPRRDGKLYQKLIKTFGDVQRGYQDQGRRIDNILDAWDAYNCQLNDNQVYNGDTEYYVPIVYNAVNARKTRFLNQAFPSSGRYIDATSSDGQLPAEQIALIEHYIRREHMKTRVISPLLINGDLEGQYNLYIDWDRAERHVAYRWYNEPQIEHPLLPGPAAMPGEGVLDIKFETIDDAGPCFEVLHDADVNIWPVTAKSVDDALRQGGHVTIIRRWTKTTIEWLIETEQVMAGPARQLINMSDDKGILREADKLPVDAAGIRQAGRFFQVYELWQKLEIPGEGERLCYSLYGGHDLILTTRRNKFWNDRCPLLSSPVEKMAGSVKGVAPVDRIMSHQYAANDTANQGQDSSLRSMMPIIMTDPAKNPRTSTMVLNLGAVWEIDPNSTRFAEFPKLWQDAIPIIQAHTALAFQTLGVNPGMLPQQTGRPGAKRNQAEIALEQTVDLLTTGEAVSVLEEGILTPAAERMVELDHQFRDDDITIRTWGELGSIAKMERVPPIQIGTRYYFTWFGVEQARNAAQMQQQIAWLNVARTFEPILKMNGYRLNPAPALVASAGNIFGWRMGRLVVQDMRASAAMDPELENALMMEGHFVAVHPLDEDPKHIQLHLQAKQAAGDPTGQIGDHINRHITAMQMKAIAGMQQQQGMGAPQGGGGAPGGAGAPAPGGQPQNIRTLRGPPGMIHQDQLPRAGAVSMPRKM